MVILGSFTCGRQSMTKIISKELPSEITSYDLLKALAVLLMIIDHVGYYFFPEEGWLRLIGRMCVPMWFFLIGYAQSRDLGLTLWGGALILVLANVITGMTVIPLNILGSMILVRLLLDPVMKLALRSVSALFGIGFILMFLILPSSVLTEYGTLGLLLAMYGYMVRRKGEFSNQLEEIFPFAAYVVFVFTVFQMVNFGFDQQQVIVLGSGIAVVMAALYLFRPATFPGLTAALPGPAVWLVQLLGRRTLEIYVLHLVAFKLAALYLGDPRLGLMAWEWVPPLR